MSQKLYSATKIIPAWRRGGVGAKGEGGRGPRRRGEACAGAAACAWRGGTAAARGRRGEARGGAGAGRDDGARRGGGAAASERRDVVTERVSGEKGEKGRTRVVYLLSLPSARDLALIKDFLKILKYSLLSASWMTLGKESFTILCRVSPRSHSAKHALPSVICGHSANYFFIFFIFPTKFFVVCSYTI
jgi:hypothetical protein